MDTPTEAARTLKSTANNRPTQTDHASGTDVAGAVQRRIIPLRVLERAQDGTDLPAGETVDNDGYVYRARSEKKMTRLQRYAGPAFVSVKLCIIILLLTQCVPDEVASIAVRCLHKRP